jgi:hypothetical protein
VNEIAAMLAAASQPGDGLRLLRATVTTWDATNGYVIYLNGSNLRDVPSLTSAGALAAGDQVAVLAQKTSLLIIGKIQIL